MVFLNPLFSFLFLLRRQTDESFGGRVCKHMSSCICKLMSVYTHTYTHKLYHNAKDTVTFATSSINLKKDFRGTTQVRLKY